MPLGPLSLFGITLLLGLLGGEIARRTRFLPPITGYIAAGLLAGPEGLNIIDQNLLTQVKIFVDMSIGLILFQLGRQLDFTWLRYDRSLLYMSFLESSLPFSLVLCVMHVCGFAWLSAALAAAIAVTTAPAVVMMVAHDLCSEGPVTRRTLMLTSLNNLYGIIGFIILVPLATKETTSLKFMLQYYGYQIISSIILGLIMFLLAKLIAAFIGKRKENQFILFIGIIILTIGLSRIFNLPMMLALFIFGIATRNFDWKHSLVEIDFEWFARIVFILLFVITGYQLQLDGLRLSVLTVCAFILSRSLAKTIGIFSFAKKGRLTLTQTLSISLALTPMAGIALGLSNKLMDFNQDLGIQISLIIGSAIAILQILGPISAQYAFVLSGEAKK